VAIASDLKSSPVRYPSTVYESSNADKQVGNVSAKLPVIPAVFARMQKDAHADGESRCRGDVAAMRQNFLEKKIDGRVMLAALLDGNWPVGIRKTRTIMGPAAIQRVSSAQTQLSRPNCAIAAQATALKRSHGRIY
jgi:hypothetical protein